MISFCQYDHKVNLLFLVKGLQGDSPGRNQLSPGRFKAYQRFMLTSSSSMESVTVMMRVLAW